MKLPAAVMPQTNNPEPLPGELDDTAHLRAIVASLARHEPTGSGAPLWSVLGDLIGCGSSMATRIVRRLGFDPDVNVIKPGWYDPETTCVQGYCSAHGKFFDLENGEKCGVCEQEAESAAESAEMRSALDEERDNGSG